MPDDLRNIEEALKERIASLVLSNEKQAADPKLSRKAHTRSLLVSRLATSLRSAVNRRTETAFAELQRRKQTVVSSCLTIKRFEAALAALVRRKVRAALTSIESKALNEARRKLAFGETPDKALAKKESWDSGLACFGQQRFAKTYGHSRDAGEFSKEAKDFTFIFEETASHPGGAPNPRLASRDNSVQKERLSARKYKELKDACFIERCPPITVEVASMNKKTKKLIDNWASNQLDARLRQVVVERLSNTKSPTTVKSVSSKSSNSKKPKLKSSKKKSVNEKTAMDTSLRNSSISQTSKKSHTKSDKTRKDQSPNKLKSKLSSQLKKSKKLQRATVSHIPPEIESIIEKCQKPFN